MVAGYVQYQLLCPNWNRPSTLHFIKNSKFSVSDMEFKMTVQETGLEGSSWATPQKLFCRHRVRFAISKKPLDSNGWIKDDARWDWRPRDQLGGHCRNCGLKLRKAEAVTVERRGSEGYWRYNWQNLRLVGSGSGGSRETAMILRCWTCANEQMPISPKKTKGRVDSDRGWRLCSFNFFLFCCVEIF